MLAIQDRSFKTAADYLSKRQRLMSVSVCICVFYLHPCLCVSELNAPCTVGSVQEAADQATMAKWGAALCRDWGDARAGSWQANGEETSLNRYMIDFETWEQQDRHKYK